MCHQKWPKGTRTGKTGLAACRAADPTSCKLSLAVLHVVAQNASPTSALSGGCMVHCAGPARRAVRRRSSRAARRERIDELSLTGAGRRDGFLQSRPACGCSLMRTMMLRDMRLCSKAPACVTFTTLRTGLVPLSGGLLLARWLLWWIPTGKSASISLQTYLR